MLGARLIWYCPMLALWLGSGCTVTVDPIRAAPDGGLGGDAGPSAEAGPRCTGASDADPGGLSAGLLAYYPCEQALETTLPDLSGNSRNAALASSATGDAGFRFSAGKVGKALYLNSSSSAHVVLPSGMLSDACEATIATWVYLNTQKTLQRVWTFSTGANAYIYLTTDHNLSGLMRAGVTLKTNPDDSAFVEGPSALPATVWTHVAVVFSTTGLLLYVDGAQVGSTSPAAIRPADLGKTLYDYIGRSNFSWDPYLDGAIDEFRVYNRALSPTEIRTLASGS